MDQFYITELNVMMADLLGPLSSKFSENITYSGGRYDRERGFFLYVGVEGNVNFEDMRGVPQVRHFVVGYHPIKMRALLSASTTATNLAACFN
jgi:hypothetical protein